uniref:holo-[acyl-carrier-protein] synthase n=1 Tax=Paulinella longichromatophora TaxID=1708747 RepID=A0A2H4ZQ50_9EUKA|nr:putative 4'-phosphopantetheinyl transferase family protein [Paulinella longichromatophora]
MWLRQWNYDLMKVHQGPCTYSPHTIDKSLYYEDIKLSKLEIDWSRKLPERMISRYQHSRRLMRQLLAPILNCTPNEVPLYSPPGKRPYLKGNCGHISFSHSRNGALLGWSLNPIGVDVESSKRSFDARKIQRRFFPLQEQKTLEHLQGEDLRKAVLRSWVCKEAAIKWQGKSLGTDLMNWHLDTHSGHLTQVRNGLTPTYSIVEHRGWLCAVVSEKSTSIYWK